jgi:hypothetical protein
MSKTTEKSTVTSESRREFVKKAAYVAPAVLSLQAASAFARNGSNIEPPPTLPPSRLP